MLKTRFYQNVESTMNKFIDITGHRFGHLVALSHDGPKAGKETKWRCQCNCGAIHFVRSGNLRKKLVLSCGCLKKEVISKRMKTHGMTGTSTYHIWLAMRSRCGVKTNPAYKNYGGRGIAVCARWQQFENFLADMGERPPQLSIERIDNNLGYSKENCKWGTRLEQTRNTRTTKLTLNKAIEIIKLRKQKVPHKIIASRFGICIPHIHDIVKGKVWAEAKALANA